ncbi:hypothetical protein OG455_02215 [Kitasatospora sp. NBC_01287]|uniref:hypothetical protein n=1 Tax=Kitasatospora sp. NBC_01287 TaxID=2903573 RepID=UPI00225A8C70|nr:hypothetical protein [Kitasatospora sp. NBC_01287]MCX4744339.1 hypothetical protein [Kitasatospora sp. NBC_01287]
MVAAISAFIGVTLFLVLLAAFLLRAAWLSWRHPLRAPRLRLTKSSDPAVIRGHERGIVPFAAGWALMPLLVVDGTVDDGLGGVTGAVAALTALLSLVGFLLGMVLHATIAWFNRPRLLVPPHRRDETGSLVEWFHHRRESAAALKSAAEQAGPGA